MRTYELDSQDQQLIDAASSVLEQNYDTERHTVGAAVLTGSGKIYSAVNVESVGYGPCAEPIAVGCAISAGERELLRIVAVGNEKAPHQVLSPCGNCRQLLCEYTPDCLVIIEHQSRLVKIRARDLLPNAYHKFLLR